MARGGAGWGVCIIFFLSCCALAGAATITGSIYDYDLALAEGAVVRLNTTPEQVIVAKDGTYRCVVGAGTYTLSINTVTAKGLVETDSSTITVEGEGEYVHDVILFPDVSEEESEDVVIEDFDASEQPVSQDARTILVAAIVLIGAVVLGGVVAGFLAAKRRTKKNDAGTERPAVRTALLDPIEEAILARLEEQGTLTQKEARQGLPCSEAKASLAVSSLEAQGRVEKLKKGRGNILRLKRKA